jgi:hypothetical protein
MKKGLRTGPFSFGGESGITRRGAPRPFGAALPVLATQEAHYFRHLGAGYSESLITYPTGVIPLRRGSSIEPSQADE